MMTEEGMERSRKEIWTGAARFSAAALVAFACALLLSPNLSAQQWQIADPGAGGAFITTSVGPTGFVFVGSDLAGIYHSSNSGGYWINAGSFNGLNEPDVSALGADPTDDDIVLAGTENSLLRSTDEGYNYTQVYSGGYWTSIAISNINDNVVYAAHHSQFNSVDGTVWKSLDNGHTWNQVSTNLPAIRIQKIVIDPTTTSTVYLLSQNDHFVSSSAAQLYKSADGGATWTELGGTPLSSDLLDFAVDPVTPTTIYVTRGGDGNTADGTYKSTDGGSTFTKVTTHRGIVQVKFDSHTTVRVLDMNGEELSGGAHPDAFQSTDSGSTWTLITTASSYHTAWLAFNYGIGYAYCKTVVADPSNSNQYYWANLQWIYSTTDGMANWNPIYTNQSNTQPGFWQGRGISNAVSENISIPESDDDTIYAGYLDLGLWRSLDEGYNWQEINEPAFTGNGASGTWSGKGGNVITVLADPVRPNVVWAGQGNTISTQQLIKSTSSGALGTWTAATGLPQGSITGLSLSYQSSSTNRTLFVCDNGGTYRSTDDGGTWSSVANSGACTVTAVDRSNGNYVYAGGSGGFWRSTDGGTTWANTGLTGLNVSWIAIDNSNPSWVYAAVFASGQGLYRSKDRGLTWTKIFTDDYLREVAVHPTNPNIIFVTSSKDDCCGGGPSTSSGVSRSTDGGSTWTQVNQGLAWPFARGLAISAEKPSLVFIGAPGNAFQRRTFSDQ